MKEKKPIYLTREAALVKLQKFCAYQDRCHQEVRSKLLKLGVRGYDLEWVITELIQDKFLDEERFARSFVRGKYSLKKWGRTKILMELKKRNISEYCIKAGLSEIDEETYRSNLQEIIQKKNATLTETDTFTQKAKLARYALGRGYESNLVWEQINEMIG